jgi:hypothetical protein
MWCPRAETSNTPRPGPPEHVIVLEAGATFRAVHPLSGQQLDHLRAARPTTLPSPGTGCRPPAATLPKLEAGGGSAEKPRTGAHFRLVGLEIRPSPGPRRQPVTLGSNEDSLTPSGPHHDRALLPPGDPVKGTDGAPPQLAGHEGGLYLSDFRRWARLRRSRAERSWALPDREQHLEGAGTSPSAVRPPHQGPGHGRSHPTEPAAKPLA